MIILAFKEDNANNFLAREFATILRRLLEIASNQYIKI